MIAIPIKPRSTATASGLSIGYKVINEIIIKKYNEYKKQYEKDQQTNKSFDKFYRKSSQDNEIDKNEKQSLFKIFTKIWMEQKMNLFL